MSTQDFDASARRGEPGRIGRADHKTRNTIRPVPGRGVPSLQQRSPEDNGHSGVTDTERSTLREVFELYIDLTAKVRAFVEVLIETWSMLAPSPNVSEIRRKILRFSTTVREVGDAAARFWRDFPMPDEGAQRSLKELAAKLPRLQKFNKQLTVEDKLATSLQDLRDVLDSCWLTTMSLYDRAGHDLRLYTNDFFDHAASRSGYAAQPRSSTTIAGASPMVSRRRG